MKKKGIRKRELAAKVQVTVRAVEFWLSGKRCPNRKLRPNIAFVLDLDAKKFHAMFDFQL
jgi:ribosome-binding protein aMBF1 (putative translation factor)